MPCVDMFHHVLTDRGICSALNSQPNTKQFLPSKFSSHFQNLYNAEGFENPFKGITGGSARQFEMVLDVHSMEIDATESGYFVMSVNSYFDPFQTIEKYDIFPGQQTSLTIATQEQKTLKEVRDSDPPEKRGCRFSDELDPAYTGRALFHEYSYKRCKYECAFEDAQAQVGCIPWDYVKPDRLSVLPICSRNLVTQFQAVMLNSSRSCDCLKDCNGLTFDVKVDKSKVDSNTMCKDHGLKRLAYSG